jgi:hypothetical protein
MNEVIPFMREEKWLSARVSEGMHEMDKSEAVCFRARQNPCAVRQKISWTQQENWKEDHEEEGFDEIQVVYPAVMGVLIWIERVASLISRSRN